jgi:hypothetical protein
MTFLLQSVCRSKCESKCESRSESSEHDESAVGMVGELNYFL